MQKTIEMSVPPHIPAHLVYDFDFFTAPSHFEAPQWGIAETLLADAPPIFYTPRNGGHWVVTRPQDTTSMFQNYEIFSSNPDFNAVKAVNPTRHLPLFYDPPEHTDARRILAPYFRLSAVKALEPYLRQVAIELIDSACRDGSFDFVGQIARIFPIAVFFRMADVSMEHREALIERSNRYLRSPDPDVRQSGLREVVEFIKGLVEERRKAPGDDLISGIVNATFLGRPITEAEVISAATTILMAGLDTVTALMSFTMAFLAKNPAHYRQIVENPGLIPAAVEELVRVNSVAVPERGCAKDAIVNGIEYKKYDRIVFLLPVQGLTDQRMEKPLAVDFHREINRHVAFGAGPHHCIGAHLARLELRVFLEEWGRRIAEFQVKDNEPISTVGGVVWSPTKLWLTVGKYI